MNGLAQMGEMGQAEMIMAVGATAQTGMTLAAMVEMAVMGEMIIPLQILPRRSTLV
jgi:hypothetical protein